MLRRISYCLLVLALVLAAAAWFLVRAGFSSRPAPGGAEAAIAATFRQWSIPPHSRDLKNPIACSPAVLKEAGAHWADHCATCHANNGNGESMLGKTMSPRPPDMRLPPTQSQSDGELYYTINNGIRFTGMPAFGPTGDNDDASWKLVCFIRRLPQLTSDELDELKSLNPRTPDEYEEERQEREFLNGGALPSAPPAGGGHQH